MARHPDDESPMSARRRVRVGYLEDVRARRMTFLLETDRRDLWFLAPDLAVTWPLSDPDRARSFPLVVCEALAVDCPLDLTLLVDGHEIRERDLGVIVRLTVEEPR